MAYLHISYSTSKDCINLKESYVVICVKCNACGRIDKSTQRQSELELYKSFLQEEKNFNGWVKGHEDIQKRNIESNIEYFEKKIAELEE